MKPFLYRYFHEKTNDRSEGGLVSIPKDREDWPRSWSEVEKKVYDRTLRVSLEGKSEEGAFFGLLKKRNSDIRNILQQSVSIENIGELLRCSYGEIERGGKKFRTVPSGGARYPLEIYVSVWGKVDGLPAGQYHYDLTNHSLDIVNGTSISTNELHKLAPNYSWLEQAHGVFVVTALFDRTVRKYGSRGYRYVLLEAGHVGQNICVAAGGAGLSSRPFGGIDEVGMEEVFDIDSEEERVIYVIVF